METARGLTERAAAWFAANFNQTIDLLALAVSILLTSFIFHGFPATAAVSSGIVALLVPLRRPGAATSWDRFLSAAPRRIAVLVVTALVLRYWIQRPLESLWFGAFWPLLGWAPSFNWARLRIRNRVVHEVLRCAFVVGMSLWLLRGFVRVTQTGSGDALWYADVLKDAVLQSRAGVFPLWVGQTIYQFNGAICPVRVAPAFPYLGILLDRITLGGLGTFALQNLLLILIGIGGALSAYFCLAALIPRARWLAVALALTYLACPGVLGLAYNRDLYMSWTTVPLLPLIWFGTVRSFEPGGRNRTMMLLGAALGLTWWCHSPIAVWSTVIAAAAQALRFWVDRGPGFGWKSAVYGLGAFMAIALYPIGAVLIYHAPGMHPAAFYSTLPGAIEYFVRDSSPATFLPLSPNGLSFSDFQIGYAIWATLLFCLLALHGRWTVRQGFPIATAALLLLLLLPIPRVCTMLWYAVPRILRDTATQWPSLRLCLLIAAATLFGAAILYASGNLNKLLQRLFLAIAFLGSLWSLAEADKFALGAAQSVRPPESSRDPFLPENTMLTRYSYAMFPDPPDNFSHGVVDPELENSLFSRATGQFITSNAAAAQEAATTVLTGELKAKGDAALSEVPFEPELPLQAGKKYLIDFHFQKQSQLNGVLHLSGTDFFREYALPEYGGPTSFGVGGAHRSTLAVWTSLGTETLKVTFIPETPIPAGKETLFAEVRFLQYDPDLLPIRIESWVPYRARVKSPAAAWLQTPRMYQPGYRALVNSTPAEVAASPDGLVRVAVPRGKSEVALSYVAPLGLAAMFFISLAAVFGGLSAAIFAGLSALRSGSRSVQASPP